MPQCGTEHRSGGVDHDGRLRGRDRRALVAQPATRPPAPRSAHPAPSRWHRGRLVTAAASVVVLAVTGGAWSAADSLTARLATTAALGGGPASDDGATDILLVGTDSRADAQGNALSAAELATLRTETVGSTNTDTIILVRIPDDGSRATAVSIPRDSAVAVPGRGTGKINGAYGSAKAETADTLVAEGVAPAEVEQRSAEAGRATLVSTVQDLTGVTVDHYAEIGLLGFVLLTDAVGGVQVCLAAPTADPFSGADFQAGVQTLTGSDALSFVRQRKNLPRGDLDRIVRQQVFMAGLAKQVLSAGTLTDPAALGRLGDALTRSVVLDDGWDVLGFAQQLAGIAGGAVRFETIPVVDPDGRNDEGQSIVEVDAAAVRTMVAGLAAPSTAATPDTAPAAPESVTVDVANASGTGGLAAAVSQQLVEQGFTGGTVDNASAQDESVVLAPSSGDAAGAAVAGALGGLPVRGDAGVDDGSVRVVLGSDFTGGSTGGSSPPLPPPAAPPPAPGAAAAPAGPPIVAAGGPPCVS